MKDDISKLKSLGSKETNYKYDDPTVEILEVFDNKYFHRDYMIEFNFSEFTSLCPKTGQPDFATIQIQYIPNKKCIETKSLKLYMFAYRSYGSFMETITNKILEDCVQVCKPKWMKVEGRFNIRGGIALNITVEYEAKA